MRKYPTVLLTIFCFLFSSCATNLTSQRRVNADGIASQAGFKKILVKTNPFILTTYERVQTPGGRIHIYIEGDGYAWVTATRPSGDPTPRDPVGLKLAAQDPFANVVYLARPCQFTPESENPACEPFYWTSGRFSEEVISSMDQAISDIVKKTQATGVDLIGYSGGAAVAILVAARRHDVQSLRTVAGNLDPEAVNRYHGASPLEGSLDPTKVASKIASLPQIHFIGGDDEVIPFSAVASFLNKMGSDRCFTTKTLPDATHTVGWVEHWDQLLSIPVACREK